MSNVYIRNINGGMPVYNAIEKAGEKIRNQNPDVVGRPTYTTSALGTNIMFTLSSLEGETDLDVIAIQIHDILEDDDACKHLGISIIKNDARPIPNAEGVIVISIG